MPGCSACNEVLVPSSGAKCFRCLSTGRPSQGLRSIQSQAVSGLVTQKFAGNTRGGLNGTVTVRSGGGFGYGNVGYSGTVRGVTQNVAYGTRGGTVALHGGYSGSYGGGYGIRRREGDSVLEQHLTTSEAECPVCPNGHTRDGSHSLHVEEEHEVEHYNCEPFVHPVKETVVQITHPAHTKTINRKLVVDKTEIFPEEVKYVHDWPVEYHYVDQIEERHFPVTQVGHAHSHNVRESSQQYTVQQSSIEEQRQDYAGRAADVTKATHEPPAPPAPVCIGGYCNPGPSDYATRPYDYSRSYSGASNRGFSTRYALPYR